MLFGGPASGLRSFGTRDLVCRQSRPGRRRRKENRTGRAAATPRFQARTSMNALSTFWRGPAPRRTMKYQREADLAWAREVAARPGCEGLFSCQQCGTCSATCPVSMYMDLGPRQIIALVREGFRDEALRSQT